jgi:type VI secretion system protein ImpM
MTARPVVGVFGKVPGRGDFLTRDLDPVFADIWHGWLARELSAARSDLQARFEEAYLQAPAWRFAITPGIAGPEVTGVMIPSVDEVGRYFPLTLAAEGAIAEPQWYEPLEALARAALEKEWTVEPWLAELAALPAPVPAASVTGVLFWGEGSPLVAPGERRFTALPSGQAFLGLFLDQEAATA